jgi:imidazoleglycerol-phosphate dehydratase/histidinol-phosphatase
MRPILFIDRDGVILKEPESDYQIDSLLKFEFIPGVISSLKTIREKTNFYLVMVTNQDGLGTDLFPTDDFTPAHELMLKTLAGEDVVFDAIHIDPTLPEAGAWTRKPGTGMLQEYIRGNGKRYDLKNSIVIGDRFSDIQLAKNLDCNAVWFADQNRSQELEAEGLSDHCILVSDNWKRITDMLVDRGTRRTARVERVTKETSITAEIDLDGRGISEISTGLHFFDHMLDQLSRHGGCDLRLLVTGDLEVDEHHTVEDTALALGELYREALGDKRGISRYGFLLPMDDSLAQVAVDFSGRPWLVWDVSFTRDMIGDVPSELFYHFFKSFSDAAGCNLNIKAWGDNSHHMIEAIFKGFARALKGAVARDLEHMELPTTKGML